ncbi:hypothetical protein DFH06DRAFT_1136147 [Mycena polygramma]|nr:hypothetical protein DFH06DRAFT_1136147 [Mycena polygramma]
MPCSATIAEGMEGTAVLLSEDKQVLADEVEQLFHNKARFPSDGRRTEKRPGTQTPNNLEPFSNPLAAASTETLRPHAVALDLMPATNSSYPTLEMFDAMLDSSPPLEVSLPPTRSRILQRRPRVPIEPKAIKYTLIRPHDFVPIQPQTYRTNFVVEHLFQSMDVQIGVNYMPWNEDGFEAISGLRRKLCGKEILRCSGALNGRYTVEEKIYTSHGRTMVKLKNQEYLCTAVVAFPEDQVNMPDIEAFMQLFGRASTQEPTLAPNA